MIKRFARLQQLTMALIVSLALSNISIGQTAEQASSSDIVTNDLQTTAVGQYKVTGPDPYIIFNAQQQADLASHLVLDLGMGLSNMPLELFFSGKNDIFDPYYRLNFIAPSFPVALALPQNVTLTSSPRLRLDVVQCPDCTIEFSDQAILSDSSADGVLVEPISVRNGTHKLAVDDKAITTNDWRLNDLNGSYSSFEISGNDPYIVSPRLDTSTHQFAGVYFKLKAPRSGEIWNNYQLFYQTDRHPFTVQASSTLRIPDSQTSITEFMIPLEFLSKERPSDSVLERIRLDLPEIPGQWAIIEARLIHQDRANQLKDLVPAQLSHTKRQRARRLSLLKKSLSNVASDLGFSICYALLLALTCFLFLRAYRSSS